MIKPGQSARKRRKRQPSAKEKAAIRLLVYERDAGRCQLHLGPKCNPNTLPFDGELLFRAHLCHIIPKSRGGKFEPDNLRIGCAQCHLGYEHTEGKTH